MPKQVVVLDTKLTDVEFTRSEISDSFKTKTQPSKIFSSKVDRNASSFENYRGDHHRQEKQQRDMEIVSQDSF